MSITSTTLKAEYRARGYDQDDEGEIRTELEAFGAVRMRSLYLPEAGGVSEFWLVVEFVGVSFAAGLIGHLSGQVYDRFSASFSRLVERYRQKHGWEPEFWLTLSYDDTDIDIGAVTPEVSKQLPTLMRSVHDHLARDPLKSASVNRIVLGMTQDEGRWLEPSLAEPYEFDSRFWGVSLEGHRQITHIYDTATNLLSEMPLDYELAPGSDAVP
jgi:hypothetical protein